MTIVYQAVVLEPISDCIGYDAPPMDEDTIGIYTDAIRANEGIERYRAAQTKDNPELDFEEAGIEFMIRPVELDKDLIFPWTETSD